MKKITIISTIILVFIQFSLHSNEILPKKTRKLNLKTAILIAQQNDVELNKLKFDSNVYHAQNEKAMKDFFPKLTSEFTRDNSVTFSNPRGTTIFSFYNSMELNVYNRALIYNKKKAHSEIRLNMIQIEKRLNDLCKEVFTLYYSVFNLKIIVQIRKEEYLKAVEFYKLTENRLKHKKVLPFDLLLSKGLMIQTKNNWVKATYDYIEEKLNLMHKLNLREDIELIEEHAPTKPNSLKESIELSLSQRPDIKEKYYDIKVKNELYEIERSVFYPKVSLFSDLRLSSFNDVSLNERKEWSIFLTVSLALMDDVSVSTSGGYKRDYLMTNPKDSESVKLSLFDGSSNIVNREKAKSNLKLTQLEMKDLEYKISREIISSYHSFLKAKDDITLAKLNLKIGEGLVKKADAEYKLGKKGMEDIIEAKEKEILYKIEYQQINLKYKLAILSLKWAMGNLWKDFF